MFQIIGTVDGIENLNRAFNRTEGFIADMRNFAPALSTEFYKAETEQFQSEGAKGASGKWAALSPAYKRWKESRFPGKKILELTGDLKESLTSGDAFDAIFIPEREQITWGSKVPYALAHHRGGRLPRRAVISLSESQKRAMQKAAQKELVEFTRKAGFQVQEEAA